MRVCSSLGRLVAPALVLLACDQAPLSPIDAAGGESNGGDANLGADGDQVGADAIVPVDLVPKTRPPADDVVRGCAKLLACLNPIQPSSYGLGGCLRDMYWLLGSELARQSYLFLWNDDSDFPAELALEQNLDCVLAAPDCEALRTCLAAGNVAASCTPPAGYYKRWCADSRHLRGCSIGTEVEFDCAALGLSCQDLVFPSSRFGTCSQPGNNSGQTLAVACDGDWATVDAWGGRLTLNCAYLGGSCVAGNYADMGDAGVPFCLGKEAATCSGGPGRCDGNQLIRCLGGREAATDCGGFEQTCLAPQDWVPHCDFAGCLTTSETCAGGVLGFCGPGGATTLECAALGLTSCVADSSSSLSTAWCSW